MVPGFVAGDYATHELEIDVAALARRAGAELVLAPATRDRPEATAHLRRRPARRSHGTSRA
jgi:selenide,water dikinase